jgi:adenylate cyclase
MDVKVALSLGVKSVPPSILINYYGPPGTFPEIPIAIAMDRDALNDRVYREMFKGAVVYVGATTPTLHDEFFVPFSRWTQKPMPGVEIHLHILSNLLNGEWLKPFPRPFGISVSLVALVLGFLLGYAFSERRAMALWLVAFVAGVWGASVVSFGRGVFLDPLWPSMSGLMGFVPSVATRTLWGAISRWMTPTF